MFGWLKRKKKDNQVEKATSTAKAELEKEERYQLYLMLRNEYYTAKSHEQDKIDHILVTGALALLAVSFTYLGLQKGTEFEWWAFYLSISFNVLCVLVSFFSSTCSVTDIKRCLPKLDYCYTEGGDLNEPIESRYYKWVARLNRIAMLFFVLAVIFLGIFVTYTSQNPLGNKETANCAEIKDNPATHNLYTKKGGGKGMDIKNKTLLTEGDEKRKPPKPKK